jgi:hypothetical protein
VSCDDGLCSLDCNGSTACDNACTDAEGCTTTP